MGLFDSVAVFSAELQSFMRRLRLIVRAIGHCEGRTGLQCNVLSPTAASMEHVRAMDGRLCIQIE